MDKSYICKKLTPKEVIHIYSDTAVRHFPKAELKPVENVQKYLENDLYMGYGLFKDEQLLSYALFLILPKEHKLLLDYYAVLEEYRNDGVGSVFLQLLRKTLTCADGIYIESENPEFSKNEQEKKIQTKRISFYQRNGAVPTGILSTLFGVPYQILFLPVLKADRQNDVCRNQNDFYREIDLIYHTMFSPEIYAKKVALKKV